MKWEYLYETFDVSSIFSMKNFVEPRMKELGLEGWEAISIFERMEFGHPKYHDYIFKRQIDG